MYLYVDIEYFNIHNIIIKLIKGVKKVRSALHHRILYHLKREIVLKIAFSFDLLFFVMLYSVLYRV